MSPYVYGGVGEGVDQEGASVGWLDEVGKFKVQPRSFLSRASLHPTSQLLVLYFVVVSTSTFDSSTNCRPKVSHCARCLRDVPYVPCPISVINWIGQNLRLWLLVLHLPPLKAHHVDISLTSC